MHQCENRPHGTRATRTGRHTPNSHWGTPVGAAGMLQEAGLPDGPLPAGNPGPGAPLGGGDCTDESDLDGLDAVRKVVLALRQGDDALYMLRQHHPGVDPKGPRLLGASQRLDMPLQQIRPPIKRVDRRETAPRNRPPPVLRHLPLSPPFGWADARQGDPPFRRPRRSGNLRISAGTAGPLRGSRQVAEPLSRTNTRRSTGSVLRGILGGGEPRGGGSYPSESGARCERVR